MTDTTRKTDAKDRAGYAPEDIPSEPRRSSYTDDSQGTGAYLRAVQRWETYSTLMTTNRTLNVPDALALGTVLEAAISGARVRWIDENHPDGVNEGTARHLVKSPENIGFLGQDDDVRDAFLRITTRAGWEVFLPVSKLVKMVRETSFAIDQP